MRKILFVTTGLLLSAQIYANPMAACKANDLDGDYSMYQASVALANLHIGNCQVNISHGMATGSCKFTAIDSSGKLDTPFDGEVSGTATINTNCSAEMELDFAPKPGVEVKSYFTMQFTPDKQSFVADFTNNFGLYGISNGTRYSPKLPATPAPPEFSGR